MYKVEKIFFSGEKMSNVWNLLFFVTCLTDYWTFLLNISQLKCCFAEKMCIFAKSKVHFVMKEWKFIISCVPWIIIKLKTNQRSKVRQRALAGNLLIICSNMEQVFSYIISLGAKPITHSTRSFFISSFLISCSSLRNNTPCGNKIAHLPVFSSILASICWKNA